MRDRRSIVAQILTVAAVLTSAPDQKIAEITRLFEVSKSPTPLDSTILRMRPSYLQEWEESARSLPESQILEPNQDRATARELPSFQQMAARIEKAMETFNHTNKAPGKLDIIDPLTGLPTVVPLRKSRPIQPKQPIKDKPHNISDTDIPAQRIKIGKQVDNFLNKFFPSHKNPKLGCKVILRPNVISFFNRGAQAGGRCEEGAHRQLAILTESYPDLHESYHLTVLSYQLHVVAALFPKNSSPFSQKLSPKVRDSALIFDSWNDVFFAYKDLIKHLESACKDLVEAPHQLECERGLKTLYSTDATAERYDLENYPLDQRSSCHRQFYNCAKEALDAAEDEEGLYKRYNICMGQG